MVALVPIRVILSDLFAKKSNSATMVVRFPHFLPRAVIRIKKDQEHHRTERASYHLRGLCIPFNHESQGPELALLDNSRPLFVRMCQFAQPWISIVLPLARVPFWEMQTF
jgi:hypothetical protein